MNFGRSIEAVSYFLPLGNVWVQVKCGILNDDFLDMQDLALQKDFNDAMAFSFLIFLIIMILNTI